MKIRRAIFILLTSLFVFSCNNTKDNADYQALKEKNLSGENLLMELVKFETEHSEHFESKVDLASFYGLIENWPKAYEYCVRAESVIKNAPKNREGKKAVCILNGTRAKVEYNTGNFDTAMEYCNAAIKDKTNGKVFAYLKGQILVSQNKLDEAFEVFDKAYKDDPDSAASEDFKSYMYLLASHDKFEDAKNILSKYFETGNYYSEFGAFASGIYEKTGDTNLSLLSTFYDFLFYSNFIPDSDKKYYFNLLSLRDKLKSEGKYSAYETVINFIESYYTLDESKNFESDFFVAQYISIYKRIQNGHVTQDDVKTLLTIEKHFTLFPSFYWNVYGAVTQVYPKANDIPAILEKIITLNNGNRYVHGARIALGKYVGLSEKDSERLLIASEVDKILAKYKKSLSIEDLNPLFDLLEMPENSYELQTLVYLKMEYKNLGLESAFLKKREFCSNKLGERIDYILN